jgi:uncharacterized protein YdaT
MPWTTKDVDKHKKGLTAAQKKKWVTIANNALSQCMKGGGNQSDCEASAIRIANSKAVETSQEADEVKNQISEAATEEQKKAQAARAKKYGIAAKPKGNVTKPSKYSSVPDDQFADPVNYVYPLSPAARATNSITRFNNPANKTAMGYTDAEWAKMGKRIASANSGKVYKAGKVVDSSSESMEGFTVELSADLAELAFGYSETYGILRSAFYAAYDMAPGGERQYHYWCKDFYMDHPDFGTALLVEVEKDDTLFLVPFELADDRVVTFSETDSWKKVAYTLAVVEEAAEADEDEPDGESISESEFSATGTTAQILEAGDVAGGGTEPLIMEVALIEPGFGNKKDNHYYPAEVLKRDAGVFKGVQMHETDHRESERSNGTWVSTILDVPVRFTETGAPVAKVGVHDPAFATKVVNLDKLGVLDKLQCSILAMGTAKKSKVDGKSANVIESITEGIFVDWVTRAGAGGRALQISEQEATMSKNGKEDEPITEGEEEPVVISEDGEEPTETEAKELSEAEVKAILDESNLPEATKKRLIAGKYAGKDALKAAVKAEVEYLKEVTGSGKVSGLGAGEAPDEKPMSETERLKKVNAAFERHGLAAPIAIKE